ncbi:MAG TPA: tetratricopeptide repeat protein [Chthonomonadaceae bacterium]|nr:tetratricopeptide repeat protein [Chthonomonadaceae bacterium]
MRMRVAARIDVLPPPFGPVRRRPVPITLRAKTLSGAAILASEQNDFPTALAYFEERLAIQRQSGDKRQISNALNNLGLSLFHQRRFAEARPLLEESLALKRELDDRRGIAMSVGNLGMIASEQGDQERARRLHEECLQICRELGDQQSIAWTVHNLGNVAYLQGEMAQARAYYVESLRLLLGTSGQAQHRLHAGQDRAGGLSAGRCGIGRAAAWGRGGGVRFPRREASAGRGDGAGEGGRAGAAAVGRAGGRSGLERGQGAVLRPGARLCAGALRPSQ